MVKYFIYKVNNIQGYFRFDCCTSVIFPPNITEATVCELLKYFSDFIGLEKEIRITSLTLMRCELNCYF